MKVEVKSESIDQQAEMGRLMQAQPALHVYIVGHTDNQGMLDANMRRAQALMTVLATRYKIDAKRTIG